MSNNFNPYILVKSFNSPETEAMLQALYSRSHISIREHLKELGIEEDEISNEKEKSIKKKLEKFYVGYGHASIGDCGSATVFIENVSILAAKAIQNTPLYNGQESSTRYIDFKEKKDFLIHHLATLMISKIIGKSDASLVLIPMDLLADVKDLIDDYYAIYDEVKETVKDNLIKELSHLDDPTKIEKIVKPASFDIARGLLPSGTFTQLSFHGSLRTLNEHFRSLKVHYLSEVREIANLVLDQLYEKFPYSFKSTEESIDHQTYEECYNGNYENYLDALRYENNSKYASDNTILQNHYLQNYKKSTIKNETLLVNPIILFGELDYGSWRDLQRHRNGYCKPILPQLMSISALKEFSEDIGIISIRNNFLDTLNTWYYTMLQNYYAPNENLSYVGSRKVNNLQIFSEKLAQFLLKYKVIIDEEILAYITPLGKNCEVVLAYSIEELEYVLNLRLQDTVHTTLINFLLDKIEEIYITYPYFKKYREKEYLRNKVVSFKRANQDILLNGVSLSEIKK